MKISEAVKELLEFGAFGFWCTLSLGLPFAYSAYQLKLGKIEGVKINCQSLGDNATAFERDVVNAPITPGYTLLGPFSIPFCIIGIAYTTGCYCSYKLFKFIGK